jgi:hypothetical protein
LRVGKEHPLADANGWTYEHLVVWVSAGNPRPPKGYTLHHRNERKDDNRIGNLEMKTKAKHSADHVAGRLRDERGRLLDGVLHDAMPRIKP